MDPARKARIKSWLEVAGWSTLVVLSAGKWAVLRNFDILDGIILAVSAPMLIAALFTLGKSEPEEKL